MLGTCNDQMIEANVDMNKVWFYRGIDLVKFNKSKHQSWKICAIVPRSLLPVKGATNTDNFLVTVGDGP
jgi:hypothetical protein